MVQISDIGMAAFLKVIKNVKYAELPKKGPKSQGKFVFKFDITDEELEQYSSEYLNSRFRSFDQEIKALKKLIYG